MRPRPVDPAWQDSENGMTALMLLVDTGFSVWIRPAMARNNEYPSLLAPPRPKDINRCAFGVELTGLALGIGRALGAW